ncbi:HU family DNA-binding protein [Nitrospina gracilis]|uniref:HU family DNA-binding protein n=1 Tax=Nitrospina gracilis TaxID=35801 RepID=UPI001F27DDF9|nr:integration host factor subunit beta [Nitrospina gracilis Nb-211]
MKRDDLAKDVLHECRKYGYEMTLKDACRTVDSFCEAIMQGLAQDGRVEIRGFGTFKTSARRARRARNPKTGEAVHMPPSTGILFHPGKELRAIVNGNSQ